MEAALQAGRSILLEIDYQGAQQVRAALPEAVSIFVLPPDLDTIEARLRGRATDSEAIIARRIADAHLQIAHCHEFDYLVVNEDLGAAHDQFQAVLVAELLRRARQDSLVRSFVRSAEGRAPIAR